MAHQVKCGVYTGHMCDCMMDWSEALSVLRSYADDRKISADYVNSLEAAVRDEQERLVATIKRYKEQLATYADITERLQSANAEMGDVLNAARERESALRAQIKRLGRSSDGHC